jgi:hypothetical protein
MMPGMWRLKLLGHGDALEDDLLFGDFKTLLEEARSIRAGRPDLRLVMTVPADALEEDRAWVRQIANRLPADSDDAVVKNSRPAKKALSVRGVALVGGQLLAQRRPA